MRLQAGMEVSKVRSQELSEVRVQLNGATGLGKGLGDKIVRETGEGLDKGMQAQLGMEISKVRC